MPDAPPPSSRRRLPEGGLRGENFFKLFFGFPLGMGLALQLLMPEAYTGIRYGTLGTPLWNGFVSGIGLGTVPTILIVWLRGPRRIPWAFTGACTLGALLMLVLWALDRAGGAS